MENFDLNLDPTPQPRKRGKGFKWGVFAVGMVFVASLLVYSGGFETVLKLLGVGASGIFEVTITNNEQWLGHNHNEQWLSGMAEMDGVGVFSAFTGTPKDPNQSAGRGMVLPIFSSPQNPSREAYLIHEYISPVVDLEFNTVKLSAIEVIDAVPSNSSISYSYQTAASIGALTSNTSFLPLEPSIINSAGGDVRVRTAILERVVSRYARIKFSFHNADPLERPAVYAASFQYRESGEVIDLPGDTPGLIARDISVRYELTNAPDNADIDILASNTSNSRVYGAANVDLSERLGYSFQTDLLPGAYALVVSAPNIETNITPFLVGVRSDITVSLSPFHLSTGQDMTADLNGDGAVNTLDLQLLLERFSS